MVCALVVVKVLMLLAKSGPNSHELHFAQHYAQEWKNPEVTLLTLMVPGLHTVFCCLNTPISLSWENGVVLERIAMDAPCKSPTGLWSYRMWEAKDHVSTQPPPPSCFQFWAHWAAQSSRNWALNSRHCFTHCPLSRESRAKCIVKWFYKWVKKNYIFS